MGSKGQMNEGNPGKKGRKVVPALCSLSGTVILMGVILFCLPVTVARIRGHEVYSVVSGSMEPAIPVGSVLFVEPAAPETVEEGDVIAFRSGGSVVSHRVVRNRVVEGEFITKGDANREEDMNPVKYTELVGGGYQALPCDGACAVPLYQQCGKGVYGLPCGLRSHAKYPGRKAEESQGGRG